jgi:glucokinase
MPASSSPRDRKSAIQEFFIGVDVGGTNIRTGVVTNTGRPLSCVVVPTQGEKGPDHGLETIRNAMVRAIDASPVRMRNITAIGLAVPGTLDIPNGIWMEPANLPTWRNIPVRQHIADHFELPVTLKNDANAAAFGEFWAGAGRGAHSLVLWTLGTGVGCGLIVNGKLVEGAHSHGGECGFLYIQMENGRPCATGMKGTLEAYAGSAGMITRCHEAIASGEHSTILSEQVAAGQDITPLLIARAAEQNDPLALRLVDDSARFMSYGTANLMHTIDPDVVLFGGNMTFGRNGTPLGRRFLQTVRDDVKGLTFPVPGENVRVDYAQLGGKAGIIGAAGCAWAAFGAESTAGMRENAG